MLKPVVGHVLCCRESKTSDYDFLKNIGSGGYGFVCKVKRKTMDEQFYALKIVKLLDRYYFVLYSTM